MTMLNTLALVASIIAVFSLGTFGGMWLRRQDIADLEDELAISRDETTRYAVGMSNAQTAAQQAKVAQDKLIEVIESYRHLKRDELIGEWKNGH
jgi:hypothetical protein